MATQLTGSLPNPAPRSVVADEILDIANGGYWQLHYLADASQFIQ